MNNALLEIDGLVAQRGGRALFQPLTLALAPGRFAALRGPNGAGKTSLLRTIAGLLRPAGGAVRLTRAGQPIPREEQGQAMLLIGHADALKAARTPRQELRYWAAALGGEAALVETALQRVGLARAADRPCRTLSAGQRRRAALARLLVVPRPLWLLDEPAASLDAAGKALLCELIRAHCAAGGAALASLHEALPLQEDLAVTLAPQ